MAPYFFPTRVHGSGWFNNSPSDRSTPADGLITAQLAVLTCPTELLLLHIVIQFSIIQHGGIVIYSWLCIKKLQLDQQTEGHEHERQGQGDTIGDAQLPPCSQ